MSLLSNEEAIKWLKLARCRGVKDETKKILMDAYKNINLAWEEFEKMIVKLRFSDNIQIPSDEDATKELLSLEEFGGHMVHLLHDSYPPLLKGVFNAPNVLLVKGKLSLLKTLHFGVVGSRVPTAISIQFAKSIVSDLVNEGFTIVSGLATGIDAVAHTVALDQNKGDCGTIAVLGNGLGQVYPKENSSLYDRISSQNGILVSEFEFNSLPTPSRFPRRNATIAGMSYGTLVVEARKNSGSLITARYASGFGREVYAVPGFPSDDRYAGTNHIIKQNLAKMTTGIDDIMDDMRPLFEVNTPRVKELDASRSLGLFGPTSCEDEPDFSNLNCDWELNSNSISEARDTLCDLISHTPVSLEQIISSSTVLSAKSVLVAILELELEGLVERTFDGRVYKSLSK